MRDFKTTIFAPILLCLSIATAAASPYVASTSTSPPPMTPYRHLADSDPYPPGCRNKESFDACALRGAGCSLGTRRACRVICEGLCND